MLRCAGRYFINDTPNFLDKFTAPSATLAELVLEQTEQPLLQGSK
jgi:hypothetical protein